jgi:hypothetical protein
MVITSGILESRLGIDKRIADYFANQRAIPSDNLFWKDKRIYLSMGFGFLTIPFAFDLMYKKGIDLNLLLHDDHVSLMEAGFDKLKKYEMGIMSYEVFIRECNTLLKGKVRQINLASDLFAIFSGSAPIHFQFENKHKALARSDFFLFTLVDLALNDEWVAEFLPYWYAVARPILLLDDFRDIEEDRISGEENTIIEMGDNKAAVAQAYSSGKKDLELLSSVNSALADFIQELLDDSLHYAPIQQLMS